MVRYCAVLAPVEARNWDACIQDVEQDRSDERRRNYVCAVVCRNISDSVYVQVLHDEQLHGVRKKYLAEHIALPVFESAVMVEILDSFHFVISKLEVEHVNIVADMFGIF